MTLTQLAKKYNLGNKFFKVQMIQSGSYIGVKYIIFAYLNMFNNQGFVRMTSNKQIIVEIL